MRFTRILLCSVLVSCLLVIAVPAAPALAATGSISVFPSSGPPGTGVSVIGSGFTPGSTYTMHFGASDIGTGSVDSGGSLVNAAFTAPLAARAAWPITVTTSAGDGSNTATFYIVPKIMLDYAQGRVGDIVKITGSGFGASASISINFDSKAATSTSSDPSGSFSNVTFTIPPATPGKHDITANDGFAYSPTVTFTVLPKITYAPNVQTVGSQVTVSGSGFTGNSPISFLIDNTSVIAGPTQTDALGSFSATSLTIPPLAMGTHVLIAQDVNTNSATANLYIRPNLSIDPKSGTAGATVRISGSGFAANAAIAITYNAASVATAPTTVNTDLGGSFSATFNVPAGASGTYPVLASDGTNSASTTFAIAAGATFNPSSGPIGTSVSLSGANFGPGLTVTITYDGTQVATATADSSGAFTATFKAPASRSGGHVVNASDGINSVALTFNIVPSASLSPTSGYVDSAVTVTGAGFAAGKSATINFDKGQVATATIDSNGAFSAIFKVPSSQAGGHQVTATDGAGAVNLSFTVQSSATISPASGFVDSNVTVKGAGFTAGRPVTISFDKAQVAADSADANGAFSISFKAPSSQSGSHQVTATDGTNSATLTFTIAPSASINPTAGYVGGNVAVKGSGFAASKAITIKYDNTQVGQSTTDGSGAFTAAFAAPASKGGNHVVAVTDGTSTVSIDFAMDSTPPPVTALLQPPDATKADAMAALAWNAVADPSGVNYTLQIAADAAFATIVLEKKALALPGYTLSDQEKLKSTSKDKPYYWRVKAIDGASNESQWSAPRSFFVGFTMPAWGLYTIFAVVALLFGVFGFWLGRKTYSY